MPSLLLKKIKSDLKRKEKDMFQLVSLSTEAPQATIPVEWCVNSELLTNLKKEKAINPQVLLIVKNLRNGKEYRQLAPLDAGMDYIQFRSHGENKVSAMIVWGTLGKLSELEDRYLRKDWGAEYNVQILDSGGNIFQDFGNWSNCMILNSAEDISEITVKVDPGLFAKYDRESKWYRWVNYTFDTPPRDECGLRKRMLFAVTIQPVIAFIFIFTKCFLGILVGLFWWGLGSKSVNWKPIFHPFVYDFRDIYYDITGTFRAKWRFDDVATWALRPTLIIGLGGIIWGLGFAFGAISFLQAIVFSLGIFAFLTLFVLVVEVFWLSFDIIFGLFTGAKRGFFSFSRRVKRMKNEKKQREIKKKKEGIPDYEKEFNYLLCSRVPNDFGKGTTPRKNTVHLRLWAVKAKLCKPISE